MHRKLEQFLQGYYEPSLHEILDLSDDNLDQSSIRKLSSSRSLAKLTHLCLARNRLEQAGIQALSEIGDLSALVNLDLRFNQIGDGGLKALCFSPLFTNRLQILDLSYNSITEQGVFALAQSPYLKELRSLKLDDNQIGDAGVLFLASSCQLHHLEELYLFRNYIAHDGVYALASSPFLSNLQILHLQKNDVEEQSLKELMYSPFLPKLHTLLPSPSEMRLRCKVIKSPQIYFQMKSDFCWRLLAYACFSPQKQISAESDFIVLAKKIYQEASTSIAWRWCEQHFFTWSLERLEQLSQHADFSCLVNRIKSLKELQEESFSLLFDHGA